MLVIYLFAMTISNTLVWYYPLNNYQSVTIQSSIRFTTCSVHKNCLLVCLFCLYVTISQKRVDLLVSPDSHDSFLVHVHGNCISGSHDMHESGGVGQALRST